MPVVLGFELNEMSFSAFSSKNMFDRKWNLRRERFIIFQLAMILGLVAECVATYSLDKYEKLQDHIEHGYKGSHLYQNDLIDSQIVLIVFCVLIATLYGTDFFFLLQFPRRVFPRWYQTTKKFLAVVITLGTLAGALSSTIVVARNSAKLSGLSSELALQALSEYYRPPLKYSSWPTNIAFVVIVWLALIFTIWSTYLMFIADKYDLAYGTGPKQSSINSNNTSQESSQAVLPMTNRSQV